MSGGDVEDDDDCDVASGGGVGVRCDDVASGGGAGGGGCATSVFGVLDIRSVLHGVWTASVCRNRPYEYQAVNALRKMYDKFKY